MKSIEENKEVYDSVLSKHSISDPEPFKLIEIHSIMLRRKINFTTWFFISLLSWGKMLLIFVYLVVIIVLSLKRKNILHL